MLSHIPLSQLPAHRVDGYLPDYSGMQPILARSPFTVKPGVLVATYGGTPKRLNLLKGLLGYRARLRTAGVVGLQWLNGSFVGDVERREKRDPGDIDVVTFFTHTGGMTQLELVSANPTLWDHSSLSSQYGLDAYSIDLRQRNAQQLLTYACYWHGLWSRSKVDAIPRMKGYVALELSHDDADDKAAMQDIAIKEAAQAAPSTVGP